MKIGSTARAAMSLTAGRSAGFAVAFVIPLVLSRYLTQEQFGVYKYLFLMYSTLGFMQLGMSESLYFFVPRSRAAAGHAVANAVASLAASGAVVAIALAVLDRSVARWTGIGAVRPYLPMLGLFIGLMLVATPLEIIMVSLKRHRLAAVTYAASDTARAAMLMTPAVAMRDVGAVLAGAVVFAAARVAALATYLVRTFGRRLRLEPGMWREQWRYAVPFSIAVVIELVQINLHQYVVAARFDAAMFAIYAVGCTQIPLVDVLSTSTANVMMVRMNDEECGTDERVRIWHDAVERLAMVFVPFAIALALTARDVIGLLYPAAYLPAVPIFTIATSLIVLAALPVDGVLRVYADTTFLIVMNLIRLAVIVAGIGAAVSALHLAGAILITVVAQVAAKTAALGRIAVLLRVPVRRVLPWRALAIVAGAAAAATIPALIVRAHTSLPVLFEGALVAGTYGAAYLAVLLAGRVGDRRALARSLAWQNRPAGR